MKTSHIYQTPSIQTVEVLSQSVLAVSGEGSIQDFDYQDMGEE